MLLHQLAAAQDYDGVFIAPHLDDAVLSCGGIIGTLRAIGNRILVVTVCGGSPDPSKPLSPFAQYLHEAWNLGPDPIAWRRQEDCAALAVLDADGLHLAELDAVYRLPAYSQRGGVFGQLQTNDPLIPAVATVLELLRRQNPGATIYLPLAVGDHVDHQAVWEARTVIADTTIAFYEDFPYARYDGAVIERIGSIPDPLRPKTVPIGDHIARKIAGIEAYASQLQELFPDQRVDQAVRSYAASIDALTPAERVWLPRP